MNSTIVTPELELRIELERRINAPIEDVFETLLEQVGPGFESPDGNPLSLQLEPRPGGRWYRDLGGNDGHLWGHVQAIKAPNLLQLRGALFMSQPVCNNVLYRLEEQGGTTLLQFVHTAFGPVTGEQRENMPRGWNHHLDRVHSHFA